MVTATEDRIQGLLTELFPIHRSLTGDGNRKTLQRLSEVTPLDIAEVPAGKSVYDWEVPPEWNITDAWIKNSNGKKIVNYADSNLHVVSYSVPVHEELAFHQLREHLHTLPSKPDAIPYRTSYYERDWGFCLREKTLNEMDENDTYEVLIDSSLDNHGSLTYGDARIAGDSNREYILSTYCCHPSLANDNLSGLVLATLLFERLRETEPYHSYRLIIAPETIGVITYLNHHQEQLKQVNGGYVITTTAGPGDFEYKESFQGDHAVDFAAVRALGDRNFTRREFRPCGSDERQYSSPGFRIPTGTIAKNKYFEYEEYHTSKDDLSFVSAESLAETLDIYWRTIELLEMNRLYERRQPYCEFKLDRHGLHPTTGGFRKQAGASVAEEDESVGKDLSSEIPQEGDVVDAINWLMYGCDGDTMIFEIANESGMSVSLLYQAARRLESAGLVDEVTDHE